MLALVHSVVKAAWYHFIQQGSVLWTPGICSLFKNRWSQAILNDMKLICDVNTGHVKLLQFRLGYFVHTVTTKVLCSSTLTERQVQTSQMCYASWAKSSNCWNTVVYNFNEFTLHWYVHCKTVCYLAQEHAVNHNLLKEHKYSYKSSCHFPLVSSTHHPSEIQYFFICNEILISSLVCSSYENTIRSLWRILYSLCSTFQVSLTNTERLYISMYSKLHDNVRVYFSTNTSRDSFWSHETKNKSA